MSTLISVVGPTAVGKTELAIQLAEALNTVVLSADSRQFYREMSIGTAKPTKAEQSRVPHFFIDNLSIRDEYSAGDFERDALETLDKLFREKKTVIMVGGSGLFLNAVWNGLDDLPKAPADVRKRLNDRFERDGIYSLQEELRQKDPVYASEVDLSNPQRVIRALEVIEASGKAFSSFRTRQHKPRAFRNVTLGLELERPVLYERINNRVEQMIQAGLVEEVRDLLPYREFPALKTVGYTEMFDYLDGLSSLEEAVGRIKQQTRRYAKRQITWFKRVPDTLWFSPQDIEKILLNVAERIEKNNLSF